MQWEFIGSGSTPQTGDTKWMLLVKTLAALQKLPGALPENNPKREDTKRILRGKIVRSLLGITTPF